MVASKDIYFSIRKSGDIWRTEGQLETNQMSDVLDLMMILLTNAVKIGLSTTDLERSVKPLEKALVAQLKDIIKVELKEARNEKHKS